MRLLSLAALLASHGALAGDYRLDPDASMHNVSHGEHFDSYYGHLDEVHVRVGQSLKRGQLIGLSGASNGGRQFLHLGICKKEGNCLTFSQTEVHTYDPKQYWLGGKPQCFDSRTDYSRDSRREITVPLACGDYARELIARTKGKDRN